MKSAKKVTHKVCPHCKKELNLKTYKDHKRLYYDISSNTWLASQAAAVMTQSLNHHGSDENSFDFSSASDKSENDEPIQYDPGGIDDDSSSSLCCKLK